MITQLQAKIIRRISDWHFDRACEYFSSHFSLTEEAMGMYESDPVQAYLLAHQAKICWDLRQLHADKIAQCDRILKHYYKRNKK